MSRPNTAGVYIYFTHAMKGNTDVLYNDHFTNYFIIQRKVCL